MAKTASEMRLAQALAPEFVAAFREDAAPRPAAALTPELETSPKLAWLSRLPARAEDPRTWRHRPLSELAMRLADIALSLAALLLLSPLLGATSLAIRLESRGPVLFRQIRAGRNGRAFTMLKFRSMVADAERDGLRLATAGDDRVTRVGHVIRRCRIDELPQLVNVLKGEMSLVGPRPEMPAVVSFNVARIPDYEDRHRVRPGITGLAQVTNGYDSSMDDVRRTVALDRLFICHLRLRNYLKILLRTVPVVLFGRGAL